MRLVRAYADPIEADLQRFYGVSLWDDMAAGRLTLRRLWVLLDHMPPGSALSIAIHGAHARWTLTDDLLAAVLSVLQGANWQRSGKGRAPQPVTRPQSKVVEQRKLDRLRQVRDRIAEAQRLRQAT